MSKSPAPVPDAGNLTTFWCPPKPNLQSHWRFRGHQLDHARYDNLSRLTSVTHKANGTTTIDGAGYAYDNAGNRIGKGNFLTGTMESYTYDNIYQLKDVHRDSTLTENYTYDEVGNRLTSTDVASYSYNSSNQLTSADATSFTYDHNGNTITKTDSNGETTYAWDYENRLTSVTLPNGGGVVSFKYDPFGRRIQKSSASGTTIYVYDGANGVEEVDASGAVLARYVQGAGIDDPLAQSRSGLSYYNADGLGSITSLTDSTGAPTATFVYGAFGVLDSSTGTTANSYRYTAREYDPETGLYYYRARYYESRNGRFLAEDPVAFDSGPNFYVYVLNDPIDYDDPYGLKRNCITKMMLVTAYSDRGPGKDWPHFAPKTRGGRPGSVGPGTVAVANTSPQPYPFGATVVVSGPTTEPFFDNRPTDPFNAPAYFGEVHDTGAGWDRNHHHVEPDTWIDIWLPYKDALKWGKKWRKVTICYEVSCDQ